MLKKIGFGVLILFVILFLVAKAKGNTTSAQEVTTVSNGYRELAVIPGISFQINQNISDQATAVTQISENVNFEETNYYTYKNGTDEYILFNMNALVVAVQKGTTFGLNESDNVEQALKNSNIMGIWFDNSGSKLEVEKAENKVTCNVNAEVVITKTMYKDYCGKLTVINTEDGEYSMFVGVPGSKYKDLPKNTKAGIETISSSLRVSDGEEAASQDTYAITITSGEENTEESTAEQLTLEEENTEEITTEEVTVEEINTEETTSEEETEEAITEETSTEEIFTEETLIEEIETEEITSEEATEESTTEEFSTEEEKTEEETTEETSTEEVITEETTQEDSNNDGIGMNLSNQKVVEKEADKAYSSTIYSMLEIGDAGFLSVYSKIAEGTDTPIIRVNNLYNKEETEEIIQSYCKEVNNYNYFTAPAGCTWVAVNYDLNYSSCKGTPYVNIKVKGVDGETLKYRGIKYSKKTYDITNNVVEENGWKCGYVCYFAIPNGCKEYVLECGDGTINTISQIQSAYYYIH